MSKDYYLVLRIDPGASPDQIKAAYRHRALQSHPDRTGTESGPFREVQEAYDVLSDPERRRAYDQIRALDRTREARRASFEPLRKVGVAPGNFGEEIEERWPFNPIPGSWREVVQCGFGAAWSAAAPPGTVHIDVALTAQQAQDGGEVRLLVPVETPCPTCRGRGGYGYYLCPDCHGVGTIAEDYPLWVGFPAGITSMHTVQVPLRQIATGARYLTVRFYLA